MKVIRLENGSCIIDGVEFTKEQIDTIERYNEFTRCKTLIIESVTEKYVFSSQTLNHIIANDFLISEMAEAYMKDPVSESVKKTNNLNSYIFYKYGCEEKIREYLEDRYTTLDKLVYNYYLSCFDWAIDKYPTYEKWGEDLDYSLPNANHILMNDYACVYAQKHIDSGITEQAFIEDVKAKLGEKSYIWTNADSDEFHKQAVVKVKEANIRKDWKAALDEYTPPKNIVKLSKEIQWALSDTDIKSLAALHKKGGKIIKEKIENLLTNCNYHSECDDFVSGNYDKWIASKNKTDIEKE